MSAEHAAFLHKLTCDIDGGEAARRLIDEKRRADAEMSIRLANLRMPADIRERARSWGMESWAEVLWNNAFQSGYREAMRDQSEGNKKEP